jgi:hypothetical protein
MAEGTVTGIVGCDALGIMDNKKEKCMNLKG